MEQGVVFCPQCNAPQIRVASPELAAIPDSFTAPPPLGGLSRYPTYSPSNGLQWPHALPAAAIGGVISAALMVFPLGALGLGMLVGGGLSVALYYRRTGGMGVTPGLGARLGALTGVFGFAVFSLMAAVEMLVNRNSGEFRAALIDALEKSAARTSGPEAQQALNWLKTPDGLTFVVALGFAVTFIFFVAISSVGGAIGAALRRRKGIF